MKNRILTVLVISTSILLIATASYAQTYTVERVIGGDTIKLTNGEEVQLIGIKTPEDEKMGQEATEFVNDLTEFCQENKVILEFDVEKRDKYGRLLAYVYCEKQYGGLGVSVFSNKYNLGERAMNGLHYEIIEDIGRLFLNASIIKSGYATPMTTPPNVQYADLFKELYEEAREQKRGLWKENIPQDAKSKFFCETHTYSGSVKIENDFKNGIKDGTEKTFFPSGNLMSVENFKDGKRHGVYRRYHDNGELWSEQYFDEGSLLDEQGKPFNGLYQMYWKNGNVCTEANVKDGYIDGLSKMYFENGNLNTVENYKDRKRNGDFKAYYENGNLYQEGYYRNGNLEGVFVIYDENGKKMYTRLYDGEGNFIAGENKGE